MKFGFGQALTRKEDAPLLRGKGCYVADVSPDGALHAVVVRSPHAHARFTVHDLARVRAMPGVRLVLTGADVSDLGPMPCLGVLPGVETDVRPYPVLASDVVRYVGDAVAFVVADTIEVAKDAAEAVTIDWQPLPHIIGAVEALEPGAMSAWEGQPNLAFEAEEGDADATKQAFAQAARVIETTIVNQRLVTNYMDTRGVVAEYDGNRYTLTLGSQGSHIIRDVIGGMVMKLPPERMRVITNDVGGGFGTKLFPYREYALAAVAAERTGKPVKWVSDRSEHFFADSQGRDNISTARLALDANNRFVGLELDIIADMGAYLHSYAPYIPLARRGHGDRRLRHSSRACAAALRLYQHRAGRRLSRRRPSGGRLSYRARGRRRRARARRSAGRASQEELHQAEGDALHHTHGQGVRLRRFRRHHGACPGTRRLERHSRNAPPSPSAPAACAASGLPPISRPAATMGRRLPISGWRRMAASLC